jgi:4-hydroxybenzoate polyprenyltransferase/phosphoserine phosphatase
LTFRHSQIAIMSTMQSVSESEDHASDMASGIPKLPLCVDLDGTLLKTDLLLESVLVLLKQNIWAVFLIASWLIRGRSFLKRELAARVPLTVETLPYRQEVLEFLWAERQAGRQLLLVTATDQRIAERIAAHIGIFDAVYGSDVLVNLRGRAKAGFLAGMLGRGTFDYIGNSYTDLPVWRAARGAYVVGNPHLAKVAGRNTPVLRFFPTPHPSVVSWIHSIRILHWTKNLLVLLPVLLAHKSSWASWRASLVGFLLFGACASGLYIVNDLLDLHSDRLHPAKNKRPFAAGEFPLWVGIIESIVLVGGSILVSIVVDLRFAAMVAGYAVLTVAYSWKLKRIPLLDVFILSSFYTIRIWAGGLIASTLVSEWLTAFSLFFFLSLAMAKRHSELQKAAQLVHDGNSGRGYLVKDRELLAMLGIASSFAAAVILSLYARSAEVGRLYANPVQLLWLCPVVLYWLSRIWLLAGRGELDHDPVLFAVRDSTSWVLGAIAVAIAIVSGLHAR